MGKKRTKINLAMCLPRHLVVKDVDDVLYRIGLCLTSVKEQPIRLSVDNPMLAFAVVSIFTIEKVVTCSLSDNHELIFRMFGSTGHLMGLRLYLDLCFIFCSILTLVSQLIYYYNYKEEVCPTFLRLFSMMSGTIPPKALGLTDPEVVVRMCRQSKKWFTFLKWHNDYWMTFLSPLFVLSFYYYKTTLFETIIFGIPNAIQFTLWVRYYWNIFFYQFLVFRFLCSYLKIKIKALNAMANHMTRNRKFLGVWKLIGSYHSIADEIHEYNTTYWSKFLLNFWLTYGLTVILLLYIALFIYIELITKFISCYVFLAFVTSFLMLILKASSVNHWAECSHVRIASLYVYYSLHNRHSKNLRLFTKFKV